MFSLDHQTGKKVVKNTWRSSEATLTSVTTVENLSGNIHGIGREA